MTAALRSNLKTMLLAMSAAAALALCLAGPARAATVIGEQFSSPGDAGFAGTVMQNYTQPPSNNQYKYLDSKMGVVTSWSTFGTASPRELVFKVGSVTDISGYAVSFTSQSDAQTVSGETTHTFPVRLRIFREQVIGLYSADGSPGLLKTTDSGQNVVVAKPGNIFTSGVDHDWERKEGYRLNLAATVEPDADEDGWGDETQDKCPGSKGDIEGCPPPKAPRPERPSAKDRKAAKKAELDRRRSGTKGAARRGKTAAGKNKGCKPGFKKVRVKVKRKGKVVRGKNGKPKTKTVCKKIKKKKAKGKAKQKAK